MADDPTTPETGPGAGVNEQGLPWWFPPDFQVDPELLAAEEATQADIHKPT